MDATFPELNRDTSNMKKLFKKIMDKREKSLNFNRLRAEEKKEKETQDCRLEKKWTFGRTVSSCFNLMRLLWFKIVRRNGQQE